MRSKGLASRRMAYLCYIAVGLYIVSLVPLLWLGRYNMPSADDFWYGIDTHYVYGTTGSIGQTLVSAGQTAATWWHTWQGTFATIFLMALQPSVFGNALYAVVPFVMIGALTAAVVSACRAVLCVVFGADKQSALLVSVVVLLFCIQLPPSAVQGLYWYNGAVHYTVPFAAMLWLFSLLIRVAYGGRFAAVKSIVACLLSVLTGAGNYVTALASTLLYGMFLLALLVKRNKWWRLVCIPCFTHCVCFGISVLAPGNAVRGARTTSGTLLRTVAQAFRQAFIFVDEQITLTLLCAVLLLAPLFWHIVVKSKVAFRLPGVVTLASVCFLSSCFYPTLFAMQNIGAGRTTNIYFYIFVLLVLFNEFYWLGYIARKTAPFSNRVGTSLPLTINNYVVARIRGLACLFACIVLAIIVLGEGYSQSSTYLAVQSIKTGDAQRYHEQLTQRYAMFEAAPNEAQLVVASLQDKPILLFFDDITRDPEDWRNRYMAQFYSITSVSAADTSGHSE